MYGSGKDAFMCSLHKHCFAGFKFCGFILSNIIACTYTHTHCDFSSSESVMTNDEDDRESSQSADEDSGKAQVKKYGNKGKKPANRLSVSWGW